VRVKPGASRYLIDLGVYLGAALTCCALTFWLLALWRADLRIPFAYGVHDELTVAIGAKWLIENPWIFSNPHLGMPFGSTMFNCAEPDVFHYLVVKLLGLTTRHFGLVMNLFYLLTFPATCLSTMYVLRQFRLGCPAAFLGSLLYTFLPYHFLRGEMHAFLAAYYLIPFVALLMFRVASESPPLLKAGSIRLEWRRTGSIAALIICVITGSSGVYHAFFACFLILVAGLAVATAQRRWAPLVSALIMLSVIATVVLLCLSPHLFLGHRNISARVSGDAETYALKITQLLLPVSGHRLPALAALKSNYWQAAPLVNENDQATLGLVGSLGFIFLLVWAALRLMGANSRWFNRDDQQTLSLAALLTLASTLLATIGGLGSLFALLVSPQIRSYNRISIFIGFFALLAVVLLIDRAGARLLKPSSKLFYYFGLALLGVIGIYDQTTPGFIPDYNAVQAAFRSDARFVREIEKKVPRGAMIFQLPYMTYPEASSYDLARGYLHSKTLRWSYGAMMNERSDLWVRSSQEQPPSEMVRRLAGAGFSGIYLDRKLLAENGPAMEAELSRILGEQPLISQESQLSFFSLESYRATLAAKQ
jgi:phosphoglycerol transferase